VQYIMFLSTIISTAKCAQIFF